LMVSLHVVIVAVGGMFERSNAMKVR
jgi:hypothetical protein